MASLMQKYDLEPGIWTLLEQTANSFLQVHGQHTVKVHIGMRIEDPTYAPALDTEEYILVRDYKPEFTLRCASSACVWLMPDGDQAARIVVTQSLY